jgi:hypothetical protein
MNLTMVRLSLIFPLILLITGCTYYSLIPRGKIEIGGVYTIRSEIPWSKASQGNTEIWTVDGPGLQELRFVNGLSDGDLLFKNATQGDLPEYKSDMSFLEIKEFIETSATAVGVVGITSRNFRPFKFGLLDGFRAEFSYTLKDGLFREGFAVGAKKENKLYLIIYSGTRLHYYPKNLEDAEFILRSIQIL